MEIRVFQQPAKSHFVTISRWLVPLVEFPRYLSDPNEIVRPSLAMVTDV